MVCPGHQGPNNRYLVHHGMVGPERQAGTGWCAWPCGGQHAVLIVSPSSLQSCTSRNAVHELLFDTTVQVRNLCNARVLYRMQSSSLYMMSVYIYIHVNKAEAGKDAVWRMYFLIGWC